MASESIYPRTPVGKIEIKEIPAHQRLTAEGKGNLFEARSAAFGKLFDYIQRHEVAMTVPVEASVSANAMSFFVGEKDTGKTLQSDENIEVQRRPSIEVLSIGLRGAYTQSLYEKGYSRIREWLAEHPEWQSKGEPYVVYWNSPAVPGILKVSEVHQPVRSATDTRVQDDPGTPQKPAAVQPETASISSIYDFTMKDIDDRDVELDAYRGKVILIVNVASRCGFTPQYAGLENIYRRYRDRGLVILGFPSNDFLSQEPGTNQEIKSFCRLKYDVTFPMFSKIKVKGKEAAPFLSLSDRREFKYRFRGRNQLEFQQIPA